MAKEPNNKPNEFDFYYADYQVTITFKAEGSKAFDELTDNERQALGLMLHMLLDVYVYTRALYLADDY